MIYGIDQNLSTTVSTSQKMLPCRYPTYIEKTIRRDRMSSQKEIYVNHKIQRRDAIIRFSYFLLQLNIKFRFNHLFSSNETSGQKKPTLYETASMSFL